MHALRVIENSSEIQIPEKAYISAPKHEISMKMCYDYQQTEGSSICTATESANFQFLNRVLMSARMCFLTYTLMFLISCT